MQKTPLRLLALAALTGAVPVAHGQEAYLKYLENRPLYHAKATEILQPTNGEEYLVAGTDPAWRDLTIATIDIHGKVVDSSWIPTGIPNLQIADLLTYESNGQERIALLASNWTTDVYLFLFDSTGKLMADWAYPLGHPAGATAFETVAIAWEPSEERLAIVVQCGPAGPYDVGLFTTDAKGYVQDEMRWYDFNVGPLPGVSQAIGLEADPWHGGFLVGLKSWANGDFGFMLLPVEANGDPKNTNVAWVTESFDASGFALDLVKDQVLVYGELFAIGPGVSYSDICVWMDKASAVHAGVVSTQDFTRFVNDAGELDTAREGLFGTADPSAFSILGLNQSTPVVSTFDVSPGTITLRNRYMTHLFGGKDLLHLSNPQTSSAGYVLDQVILGGGNGSFTQYTRRTASGEADPHCESKVTKLHDTLEPHSALFPAIQVKGTFHQGLHLGSPTLSLPLVERDLCDYKGFLNGTAK